MHDGAILIGHSIGGTILINTLAQSPPRHRKLGAIILVAAPYVGEGGWPAEAFEAKSRLGASLPQDTPIHLCSMAVRMTPRCSRVMSIFTRQAFR